ncbi:MAG: FeoB-associated Cys-rich membrane protein [Aristaeellaceae bacterium]
MENVLILLMVAAIIGGIIVYLMRAKKRGETCIGCPYARQCGGKCKSHAPTDHPST